MPKWTKWGIDTESDSTYMKVLLIDPKKVRDNCTILETDVIVFAKVAHNDPQFEQKWATALQKGEQRANILNQDKAFALDSKSVCGNCGEPFEGEDYLCHECRESAD